MATQSIETQTLNKCFPTLVASIQQSPRDIADRLKAILAPSTESFIANPHNNDDDKARRIIRAVLNEVEIKKDFYREFEKALEDAGTWTSSALKVIQKTYRKLKQDTEHMVLVKHQLSIAEIWKEKLASGQTKSPQELFTDSTFKRPPTLTAPPESVEQYLSAVLESVEVDCGYYDDFLDVLKRLGQWGEVWAETLEETKEKLTSGREGMKRCRRPFL